MTDYESEKVRLLREAITNASPEFAAAGAVRRFEKEAIPLPKELVAEPGAPKWRQRVLADAGSMWRELVMAEPEGLSLYRLRHSVHFGDGRKAEALRLLRNSGTVTESREEDLLAEAERIVLRAVL